MALDELDEKRGDQLPGGAPMLPQEVEEFIGYNLT
ncbi:MAG: hypothetical protein RL248_24 [Pseudomonadota bacterium]|jgi:hypothetical protein